MYNPDYENILETKPVVSYSRKVIDEIERLAVDPDNIQPFGSYIYRYQKFPGDIDLVEPVMTDSKEDTIKIFVKRIKEIVKDVTSRSTNFYSEIKCGIDGAYQINIGYLEGGIFYVDKDCLNNINNLNRNNLLEKEDYFNLHNILRHDILDQDAWDFVIKVMRKYLVLRWTAKEVLKGIKKLRGNRTITLTKACEYFTLVKIDEIVLINGIFTEVTNSFRLRYVDKDGQVLEFSSEAEPPLLTLEIEKLYYSNLWYSPFKMYKRIYSYCRHKSFKNDRYHDQYINILNKIIPILSGNISLLYQIKSDFSSLVLIMELYGNKQIKNINKQLNFTKNRLSYVTEINRDELKEMLYNIDLITESSNIEERISLLNGLMDEFTVLINYYSIKYLNDIQLNPPSSLLLPYKEILSLRWPNSELYSKKNINMYNRQIVRQPLDNPQIEYEKHIHNIINYKETINLYNKDLSNDNIKLKLRDIIYQQ